MPRWRCFVWGDDLSCVCVSSGVPLPQIHWIVDGAVLNILQCCFSRGHCKHHNRFGNLNATVCVSENLTGLAIMEIQVYSQAEKSKGRRDAIMCFPRILHSCICQTSVWLHYHSHRGCCAGGGSQFLRINITPNRNRKSCYSLRNSLGSC